MELLVAFLLFALNGHIRGQEENGESFSQCVVQ